MAPLKRFLARVFNVFRPGRAEPELSREVEAHMTLLQEEFERKGLPPAAARTAARRSFGSVEHAKDLHRDARSFVWLLDLSRDVRHAARSLRRSPVYAVVAIVTLALGIGANVAMFSVLNTYMLRPLPYPESNRLMRVFRTSIHSQSWPHSFPNYLDHRSRNTVFEHLALYTGLRQSLTTDGQPAEGLQGLQVTSDFFPALGVPPAMGRWFTKAEDEPAANNVVILSDGFWRRRFGADRAVLGKTLRLEGQSVTVVGVMPPGFEHQLLWGPIDLWRPFTIPVQARQNRNSNSYQEVGRLKTGVTREQAEQSMMQLAANLSKETKLNQDESLRLEPLQRSQVDDVGRSAMWLAFGLSGFVLLIACANLANLQLVRTAAHVREHTIRAALGAGRFRLLRQSLTESSVVALAGGIASFLVARVVVELVNRRLFVDLPLARVTLDVRVFAFTLLCAVLTGLLFGAVPALLASRADVNHALSDRPRGSTSSSHSRFQHALIVSEVAFALVLLTGSGLFLRGLQRFGQRDPGWRVDGLVTAQLGLRGPNYAKPEQRLAFFKALDERLRALPGVVDVAFSSSQPIGGFNSSGPLVAEGQPEPQQGHYREVFMENVSPRYFQTLGIRLTAGRLFTADDTGDKPRVIVLSERTAAQYWPNESAIGKRLKFPGPPSETNRWMEVVGVVNDVGFPGSLAEPYTRLESFTPIAQGFILGVNITMRTTLSPESMTQPLRRVAAELIPASPVNRIRTARALVDQNLGSTELFASLLGGFAVLGLGLAAIGIYGVTSYSVTRRTGELGIRMALGAQAIDVLRLVLQRGTGFILLGVALGALGAYGVAQVLMSMIPTLPAREPMTPIALGLALTVVALIACYLPARRASKMEPAVALRHE
jgi:putative ABC transport system permease protein